MKRKSDDIAGEDTTHKSHTKKPKGSTQEDIELYFRTNLFAPKVLKQYTEECANSKPYKHAVIQELVDDSLLRQVRSEIQENVHFTPKETDIYKIHQSGDLANLDGLDDTALSKLPSLLKLRDALYSPAFRKYVATVTNSGELSGRKTDMAINVYTPGCHLLCHDDVIGSRRVSYILYLTDPDISWQKDWGGALRLYPTITVKDEDGGLSKTPSPDFSKSIPPAWNQLSFFAVQPGESFHDVEEVYHAADKKQQEKEGGRVRMAISGWYHIPQIGEDGYIEGAEEMLAARSSLVQLQRKADRYDFPKEQIIDVENIQESLRELGLDVPDTDFLLKYMAPTYLTPDTMEQVAEHFTRESSVTLDGLLSSKFAARIRKHLEEQELSKLLGSTAEIEQGPWKVARPPHKHRFLYLQQSDPTNGLSKTLTDEQSPLQELLDVFLPSREFRLWLEIATECSIEDYSILARRFRRGQDYALATSHIGEPRLELCLSLTPTPGWGDDDPEADTSSSAKPNDKSKEQEKGKGKGKTQAEAPLPEPEEDNDVGGHEVYMAGDDADDGDAAVYKASADPEDDNMLFTVPPAWNKMSIVLRDDGVLKFVKYISKAAKGDRWDVAGAFGVKEETNGEEPSLNDGADVEEQESVEGRKGDDPWLHSGEEEGNHEIEKGSEKRDISASQSTGEVAFSASQGTLGLESSEGEDFNGFRESEDSDSD